MSTAVGRLKVDHPLLGESGGALLHAEIESGWTRFSDNIVGRYFTFINVPNGDPITCLHNLGVNLTEFDVFIYSGTYPTTLAPIDDPTNLASPWAIAETGGSSKISLTITAPAAGGPHTGAVFLFQNKGPEVKAARVNKIVTATGTLSNKRIHMVDSTGGAINLTLPPPDVNLYIPIKDIGGAAQTNLITILPNGAQTIDGAPTYPFVANFEANVFVSDGTDYFVI
jgi:hypothetical protein